MYSISTVLYCTVLYCTVLYCTVLYCTVLYCTVLYCTVLYCTVGYGMCAHVRVGANERAHFRFGVNAHPLSSYYFTTGCFALVHNLWDLRFLMDKRELCTKFMYSHSSPKLCFIGIECH